MVRSKWCCIPERSPLSGLREPQAGHPQATQQRDLHGRRLCQLAGRRDTAAARDAKRAAQRPHTDGQWVDENAAALRAFGGIDTACEQYTSSLDAYTARIAADASR